MEYILLILLILVLGAYITMRLVIKAKINQEKTEIINILNKYGTYYKENNLFEYKSNLYKVAFLVVKQEEELIINNTYIFEKFYKTKNELLNVEYLNDDIFKTLVIVYPSNAPIKRYINENELVFIDNIFVSDKYLLTQKYYLEELLQSGIDL